MSQPIVRGPRGGSLFAMGTLLLALSLPVTGARAQDVDSLYRFGLDQLEQGDTENAINTFRKVLELNPNYALAHSSLGYIYMRRGNGDLALASFDRAIDLDMRLAAAHNGRGMVLAQEERMRPEALDSYREALTLDPGYLDARYNLGVTLAEMEDFRGARQAFEQLVEADPDYSDVHYRLGVIASNEGDFDVALEEFRDQYRLAPNHRENRLELGRLYFRQEQYADAEDLLLPMISQFPDFTPAMLLLADVYLAVEDYTRANQLYLLSYKDFEDEETADRLWQDVVDITTDKEREEYHNTALEDMPDFFRRFWIKRDPDPTTPATNERMVEHYRRLRYARQYFHSPTTMGQYDDRGRIYVRYGEPDERAGYGAADSETRPNDSWAYWTGLKERLIVHFVDRGQGYFQQVESLMEASETNPITILAGLENPGDLSPTTSDLTVDRIPINAYRERAILDPLFDRIADEMEEVIRNAQGEGGGVEAVSTYVELLSTLLETERMENLQDLVTFESSTHYVNIEPPDPLPFSFYTAAFKDIQGRTRVEVYYGIPTTELELERYGEGQKARVDLGVAIFDENWNEIDRTNEIREYLSNEVIEQQEGSVMVDLNMMRSMPGMYNFAISLTDLNSGRVGVVRDSLRVEEFTGRSLAISDIEMAGSIGSRRGGRFYREGVEVIPMPTRTYTTEQPIFIYYELYNLSKDDFGTTAFQVSYGIQPADEARQRGVISSAFRGLGRLVGIGKPAEVSVELDVEYGIRTQENRWLELEFDDPKAGLYQIMLTVKDVNNGTEYERIQQFMVTPPPEIRPN
ncbi:tetratricopeptide repeat protein [Candidatus Zixiibacteriota bacterium]